MNKIRKGDEVVVLAGKDKGRRGVVLRVVDAERVLVEGVNKVKRHTRPNPMRGQVGGVVEKEMSIHRSNVALFDSAGGSGSRVGVKVLEDGKKVRVFRSTGEVVGG